jgi:shikimate 5-dehydrogenase
MEALDRADRKGYMPDAICNAYEGFEYRDPASTVAALTAQRDAALARVAELEKDAARYRWLRSVPNAFKAQRIVNDTPHGMDATIDAAMNGGNQ